eukprot:gene13166-biopygen7993
MAGCRCLEHGGVQACRRQIMGLSPADHGPVAGRFQWSCCRGWAAGGAGGTAAAVTFGLPPTRRQLRAKGRGSQGNGTANTAKRPTQPTHNRSGQ